MMDIHQTTVSCVRLSLFVLIDLDGFLQYCFNKKKMNVYHKSRGNFELANIYTEKYKAR